MKLKITITGSKVHDVGYRPYLTELAMRLALRGFEVYNDEEDEQQAVIALVEGDEQRVTRFYNSTITERPQLARVDNVKSEDYIGNIMPSWQYATMNTSSQMNKAIPILLEIGDDLKAAKGNTDAIPQILEEIKGGRDELQPGFAMQFRQMQADVRAIKERLGMS
jgi:acylphosphatase